MGGVSLDIYIESLGVYICIQKYLCTGICWMTGASGAKTPTLEFAVYPKGSFERKSWDFCAACVGLCPHMATLFVNTRPQKNTKPDSKFSVTTWDSCWLRCCFGS